MPPASDGHRLSKENKIAQSISVNRAMAEVPPASNSHELTTKVSGGVHAIPFLHSIDCGRFPQSIVARTGSGAWYRPTHATTLQKVAGSIHLGRTQHVFSRATGTQPT